MSMNELYLVKLPVFLAKEWAARSGGTDVGIWSEVDAGSSSGGASSGAKKRKLRLSEEAGYPAELPREYDTTDAQRKPGAFNYTGVIPQRDKEPDDEVHPHLTGFVTHTGDIRPALGHEYMTMMRERHEKAAEIRPPDVIPEKEAINLLPGAIPLKGGKYQRKDKRERAQQEKEGGESKEKTKADLRTRLFEKFSGEGRKWWAKRDLAAELGVKTTDKMLQELLDDVAYREPYGPHKTEYRLKD